MHAFENRIELLAHSWDEGFNLHNLKLYWQNWFFATQQSLFGKGTSMHLFHLVCHALFCRYAVSELIIKVQWENTKML